MLFYILYDFTFKEISKINGVSVDSISSKYKRIIDKIRKHYEGDDSYFREDEDPVEIVT